MIEINKKLINKLLILIIYQLMEKRLTANKLYKSVKTWSDLINTNIDFMNGKINKTFYHNGPLNKETHNNSIFEPCIELNKLQLLTHNSQPYIYDIDKDENCDVHQKSYIAFYSESHIGKQLYEALIKDERVFVSYENYDLQTFDDNFNCDKYNLTRKRITSERINLYKTHRPKEVDGYYHITNWWRDNLSEYNIYLPYVRKYPIIEYMLSNCCNFMVVCKGDESAPVIVLEIMKSLI